MTSETYQELCEVVHAIAETSRSYADQSFLDRWRKWARIFVSGLYYSKSALRAADSAFIEADECVREQPLLYRVAMAAALAATGVAHAADNDEAASRQKAGAAKNLIAGIGLSRLGSIVPLDLSEAVVHPQSQRRDPATYIRGARSG